MKKGLITSQIVKNIFITMLLFYFYFNTSNGKVILLPFLICSVAVLLKNSSFIYEEFRLKYCKLTFFMIEYNQLIS